uniref:Uncharacterized protein n=1 Tax=Musa acuminata subsp. malaccensis TaxID=214687 RepID=A0A804L150_MUSAM
MKDLEDIWRSTRERGSFAVEMNAGLQDPAFMGTGIRIGCCRCVLCKLWHLFPDVWERI